MGIGLYLLPFSGRLTCSLYGCNTSITSLGIAPHIYESGFTDIS